MAQLRTHIDFETRSLADLRAVGEHAYAQHPTALPLMLAYNTRGMNRTKVEDFFETPNYSANAVPECPREIRDAIARGDTFVAHNARFEQSIWYWVCHVRWGWPMPELWSCTARRARYWGLRASLDGAASDLELTVQKDKRGKEFIDTFCKPRRKIKGVIRKPWAEPWEEPVKWQEGLEYCGTDVDVEMGIDDLLPDLPPFEQSIWELDFKMNTRGLPIDVENVDRATVFSEVYTAEAVAKFNAITGLNPTQRDRVLEYINQREEIEELGDLRSKTLRRLITTDFPEDLRDVIDIRLETSKASVKKLIKMRSCTTSDGRARGLFLDYGAHTGRWTAKRIQPQNFTRGNKHTQKAVHAFLERWGPDWQDKADLIFARPLGALASSMRGFIKAPEGKKIVVGDYAQIEARVLAWLAREMELLEAFRQGKDPYVGFGAKYIYIRDYDDCFEIVDGRRQVKEDFGKQRQVSKSAVLGAGFGLGKRQFVVYCDNQDIIITEAEAETTITAYRKAHPAICHWETGLWARCERAAIIATTSEGKRIGVRGTDIIFTVHRIDEQRYWLLCYLPSGRHIAYYRPKVRLGTRFGRTKEILSFRTEWVGKSYREDTYGGKLVENIVQGTARDIMALGALNAEAAGYPVIGLVHDEVVTLPDDAFNGDKAHEKLCELMCDLPAWVTDCPIEAEGGTLYRYGK